jgi:outer membrane putative beta-barrel porin/alpha-amylase
MNRFGFVLLAAALAAPLHAQTIDDGIMMAGHALQVGNIYTHDSWDQYWEGTLKRTNGNIGTITTQTNSQTFAYGFTDRVTVLGNVPLVWTNPSMGVLAGQRGMQDLVLAGKYSFLERTPGRKGMLRAIFVLEGALPLTKYTPDFAPLSIGNHSRRMAARLTLNYQSNPGWYLNASGAYWRRADVTLDRPYYFTDNQFFLTNVVDMPDVTDWIVSAGYLKHNLNANISWMQQTTQGGGDIRRQDMPFVSNRVNFSRIGAMAMYPVPKMDRLAFQLAASHIVDGRNVGQATTIGVGFLYALHDRGRQIR